MTRHAPSSVLAVAAVSLALVADSAGASPTLGWQYLYDGGSLQADTGLRVLTDAAGNPVVAGEVTDAAGNGNLMIVKLARATGDTLWSRSVLGTAENPKAIGDMTWDGAGDLLIGGARLGCYG